MEQYIPKDALVAEIERRRESNAKDRYFGRLVEDNYFLDFLDTLEVKEVELTWEDVREICTQSVLVEIDLGGLVSDERHYTEVLKRFKSQKGE